MRYAVGLPRPPSSPKKAEEGAHRPLTPTKRQRNIGVITKKTRHAHADLFLAPREGRHDYRHNRLLRGRHPVRGPARAAFSSVSPVPCPLTRPSVAHQYQSSKGATNKGRSGQEEGKGVHSGNETITVYDPRKQRGSHQERADAHQCTTGMAHPYNEPTVALWRRAGSQRGVAAAAPRYAHHQRWRAEKDEEEHSQTAVEARHER